MVNIAVLLENTTESPRLKGRHGLSLYAETETHKLLFDTGPNALFLKNAKVLGVDIAAVDIAVISHEHVDHCGRLKYFLKRTGRQGFTCARRPWRHTMSRPSASPLRPTF